MVEVRQHIENIPREDFKSTLFPTAKVKTRCIHLAHSKHTAGTVLHRFVMYNTIWYKTDNAQNYMLYNR